MKAKEFVGIGVAALLGFAPLSAIAAPRAASTTPVKTEKAPAIKAPKAAATTTTTTRGASTTAAPKTNALSSTRATSPKAPLVSTKAKASGNTGIVPPSVLDRIGHGGDRPHAIETGKSSSPRTAPSNRRMVFGGGRGDHGKRHILETVFTGEQGYDPARSYQAVLDRGALVNSSQNRVALRNALISGSKLPAVSNPGGATVHHVLCHILAMKRIVEVALPGGQKGTGVEYIADAGQGKYAAHLIYRNGEQLVDVPVDQAPAGTKHVAFLEGSSTGQSIIAGKSMGDTWAFWDVIKNGYQNPLDTGAKLNGTNVTESDSLTSAIDGLMSMTTRDAQSRQLLQIAPRMRGMAPDSPGQYSHRQVLMNSIVSAGLVSRDEAKAPAYARVIPNDVERELYKGTYDAGSRLSFVKAVEKLVRDEPPRANEPTVYGFGRKADSFDTSFQRE